MGMRVSGQFAELNKTGGTLKDTFFGQPVVVHYDDRFQMAAVVDDQGKQLPAVTAFWFAWFSFYPFTEVFELERDK